MTNSNEASLENAGTKLINVKKNVAHRLIRSNSKTPFRIIQERLKNNENPICLLVEDANNLIAEYGNYSVFKFYEENKIYIPIAEKKLVELSAFSIYIPAYDLIEKFGKPAREFITMMEESQKPLLCIDESIANYACLLISAITQTSLLSKHWKDLPNGEELLFKADEHFEELCSSLKIPRRTRSIMNRKKVEKQTPVEILNNN